MSDYTLQATSPLGGYERKFGDLTIAEVVDQKLYSIAAASFEQLLGMPAPAVGTSCQSTDQKIELLRLQPDQVFLKCAEIPDELCSSGYVTDQSDSWVMLRVSGPGCRHALRRTCMLDLDSGAFPAGAVARTTMEHLSVIIQCEGPVSFLLLSPRSSAKSFLHVIATSAHYVS